MSNDTRVGLTRVPFFSDPGEEGDFLDQVDGRFRDGRVGECELDGLSKRRGGVFGIEERMTEDFRNLAERN
jgi:hypothetical protein